LLARWTEVRAAAGLRNAGNGRAALNAGPAKTVVHLERAAAEAAAVSLLAGETVGNRRADTPHERAELRRGELVGALRRVNARSPEGLGGVDVAEPGDDTLVEQHRLDGAAARTKRVAQHLFGERIGLRTECQPRRAPWRVVGDGAQRARINQAETLAALQGEGHAGEPGKRRSRWRDCPVAIHPEVHGDHRAVVEHQVLVLGVPFNPKHGAARDALNVARRQGAPL
jgi:hypothetical protein